MPQPTNSKRGAIAHVGAVTGRTENASVNGPLPAPLTTRTLRPRYTNSMNAGPSPSTRSTNPRKSALRSSIRTRTVLESEPINSNSLPSSSRSMARSEEEQPIAGPSSSSSMAYLRPRFPEGSESEGGRPVKRRKTGRAESESPEWTSDGDEEVDQLISDNDNDNEDEDEDGALLGPGSTLEFEAGPPPSQLESVTVDDTEERETSPEPSTSNRDVVSTPVSSPSLAKILHSTNIEPQGLRSPSPVIVAVTSTSISASNAKYTATKPPATKLPPPLPEAEPLSEYTCPICFFPPTNATLTPCGHICCGSCLFTAVRTTMQRGAIMMADGNGARCPVCRAEIPNWDGRGGGVIGLKPRAVFSL
ncbi:hypothetical protein BDZ94DRAFT_1272259 [Collybia nuda]|uniref:RING-type domain-containing protein n=1 Tax=Collybia nuda TaxID=64659 RepID=A0A9P6C9W0_9AGAR|nr:hypothetical protein BDZ94DRAFT_1272259 [Collybia nuda]